MINTNSFFIRKCIVALPILMLIGCTSTHWDRVVARVPAIKAYQIDIAQGNVVTKEQMQMIKLGATADEVREQLGSPTLVDVFHPNRWDYHFSFERDGQPLQNRTVTLFFQDGRLNSIKAPNLPSEADFSAAISTFIPDGKAAKTQRASEPKSAQPLPARKSSPAQIAPQGAVRTYPPLETP